MSRPAVLGMFVRPAARLLAAAQAVAVVLTRRRMLGHIGAMDDRMLRDIGLSRHDVSSIAAEPLFRDPMAGLATRARETRVAAWASARERDAHRALTRSWAEERDAA